MDQVRKFFAFLFSLPQKIFGSRNERLLKHYAGTVKRINALEPEIAKLSDGALRGKTAEFRKRLADGAKLEELLPEAFAVARAPSKPPLPIRPFALPLLGRM